MLQFPIFNFLLIQINSFTNHQNGILACARIYFLLYFFLLQSILINLLVFFNFINSRTHNTLLVVFRTERQCEDTSSESKQKMLMAAGLAILILIDL